MRRIALGALFLAAACTAETTPDVNAERVAIMKADSAWLAAATSRNVDSTLSFWTDDARVIGPGMPPVVGRDSIRKMIAEGFAAPEFSVTWNTTDIMVGPSGDIAYSFGTNRFTMRNAAGGVDTLYGQGVVVWRKGDDGRWRSAVDMSTPQRPAAPTATSTPVVQ